MPTQRGRDLAELDAVAVELDLRILDRSVTWMSYGGTSGRTRWSPPGWMIARSMSWRWMSLSRLRLSLGMSRSAASNSM
jgi:hypothetical protein